MCTISHQPEGQSDYLSVKHLNPRQGITTRSRRARRRSSRLLRLASVKHLNPRQGITTSVQIGVSFFSPSQPRVKHLNPRQGITTQNNPPNHQPEIDAKCETPKSPPGDYNFVSDLPLYIYIFD